jgi:hypothetical protein
MKTYGHFIDGAYVDPIKGNTIDSYNTRGRFGVGIGPVTTAPQ